jgi:hypothetical protein
MCSCSFSFGYCIVCSLWKYSSDYPLRILNLFLIDIEWFCIKNEWTITSIWTSGISATGATWLAVLPSLEFFPGCPFRRGLAGFILKRRNTVYVNLTTMQITSNELVLCKSLIVVYCYSRFIKLRYKYAYIMKREWRYDHKLWDKKLGVCFIRGEPLYLCYHH